MGSPSFPKLRGDSPKPGQTQDNVSNQLQPIAKALAATPIMGAPAPDWIKPDLQVCEVGPPSFSWTNTPGFASAGYHRDALGYVHVKGSVTNLGAGASSLFILTLPMGYRTLEAQRFVVRGDAASYQSLLLNIDGTVVPEVAVPAAGTVDLVMTFLAEA